MFPGKLLQPQLRGGVALQVAGEEASFVPLQLKVSRNSSGCGTAFDQPLSLKCRLMSSGLRLREQLVRTSTKVAIECYLGEIQQRGPLPLILSGNAGNVIAKVANGILVRLD